MSNYGKQVEVIKDIFGVYFGSCFKFMDSKSKAPRSKKLSFDSDKDKLNKYIDIVAEIIKGSGPDGKETFDEITDKCRDISSNDLVQVIGISTLIYLYNINIYLTGSSVNVDYSIYPDNYKKGSRNNDCYIIFCDMGKYLIKPSFYDISVGKLKIALALIDYSRSQINRSNDKVEIKSRPLQVIEMPLSFNTGTNPQGPIESSAELDVPNTTGSLDKYEYAILRTLVDDSLKKAISTGSAGPMFRNRVHDSIPKDTKLIDLVESCSINLEPIKSFILWKLIVASQIRQDATILCRVELPVPDVAIEEIKNWLIENGFENPKVLNRELFVMSNTHNVEHYVEVHVKWDWIDTERN